MTVLEKKENLLEIWNKVGEDYLSTFPDCAHITWISGDPMDQAKVFEQ
jgi:hypothetical protein